MKILKWDDIILADMYLAKISSQHQITIPVEIMRRLGLSQADRLMISLEQGKIILQPQKKSVADELAGSLDHLIAENKKGKNLKEIMRKTKIATAKKLVQESSPEDWMTTVWLDSNIFLRQLCADVPKQHQQANAIFKAIEDKQLKGLVSILVINEVLWILENFYELNRDDFADKLLKLLALKNIKIVELSKKDGLKLLKKWSETSVDLTDIYLAQGSKDKSHPVASFDQDFKKLGIQVYKPA